MNHNYSILVNSDGSFNIKAIMNMAHRRVKAGMEKNKVCAARWPHFIMPSYSQEFKNELLDVWSWARSIKEYNSRIAA
jgi:hypothetical protein